LKKLVIQSTLLLSAVALSARDDDIQPAEEVTVPIEIVGTSPIIEIHVNGEPVSVHFDLGNADGVSLFPAFLDQIKKEKIGETGGRKSLYGAEDGKPVYRVDRVQIGDIEFVDFDVVEDFHDAEFQTNFIEERGAYGFVGPGLFLDHKLVIDYQRRELTIISPEVPIEQQSSCRGREIKLMPGSNLDVGALALASTEVGDVRLVWDTGAPANIILKDWTDAASLELPEYEELTVDKLSFGDLNLGPASFYVRDFKIPPFDGLIGYPFFRDHVVCFDIPGNRLLVSESY